MGKVIITNKHNLPEPLVKATMLDTHKMTGDISCTQMIGPAQIRQIKKKHTIEEDVVDRIYALIGSAMHNVLERSNINEVRRRAFLEVIETMRINKAPEDIVKTVFKLMMQYFPEIESRYLYETNFTMDVNGYELSCTIDLYDKELRLLQDYKLTKVWKYIFPESRNEWNHQLNVYARVLDFHGYPVEKAELITIFKDWSKHKVGETNYPDCQVKVIPVPLHPIETIHNYIVKRIDYHRCADNGDIPECTGKERWATSDTWVVKAKGGKKALPGSKCDSESAAKQWILAHGAKHNQPFVEFRPGRSLRCEEYCPVRQFCPQRAKMINK